MSKIRIVLGLTAALLATTSVAMAADPVDEGYDVGGWYISATGGIVRIFDTDFDTPFGDGEVEFDYGGRGGVALGHYWGDNWRGELEFAYSRSDADEFDPDGPGPDIDLDGSLEIFSLLAKIDYEMQFGWWRPYIGIGAGGAVVQADDIGFGGGLPSFDGEDIVFAGAVEIGSNFSLSDQVELFTQSQLMILSDADIEFGGSPFEGTLERPLVWSSSLGLRIKF